MCRFGVRNYTMLVLMYRHGLWVSKPIGMRLADIDLDAGRVWVKRKK